MGKRFRQDWRGTILKNGTWIRLLKSDVCYASVSPPPTDFGIIKISLWQKFIKWIIRKFGGKECP